MQIHILKSNMLTAGHNILGKIKIERKMSRVRVSCTGEKLITLILPVVHVIILRSPANVKVGVTIDFFQLIT